MLNKVFRRYDMYQFRKSIEQDKSQLADLFAESFGSLALNHGALEPIANRYWVALYEDKIVAVTGILPIYKSDFSGYEVTWTCTSNKHRKKGLIVQMLQKAETELPNDHIPLYCNCWRIRDNDKINMYSVMKHMDMHEVVRQRIKRVNPHSIDCCGCAQFQKECYCCGDLYMKNR